MVSFLLLVTVTISSILIPISVSSILSPEFTRSPENVTVNEGDTATFVCEIPRDLNRTIFWVKGDIFVDARDIISEEDIIKPNMTKYSVKQTEIGSNIIYTMNITNVGSDDVGSYCCATLNNTNEWVMFTPATLTLEQQELPSFECITSPEKAKVGQVVTFSCMFNKTLYRSLHLKWDRTQVLNDIATSPTFGGSGQVFPGEPLTVNWTMHESDNFESFTCYAGLKVKVVCVTTPLQLDPSPIVVQHEDQDNIVSGDNASFHCETVIDFPSITHYYWNISSNDADHYDVGYLSLNTTTERFLIENEGRVLVISNLTDIDTGFEISCQILNTIGIKYTSPVLNFESDQSPGPPGPEDGSGSPTGGAELEPSPGVPGPEDGPNSQKGSTDYKLVIIIICSAAAGVVLIISLVGCACHGKCNMMDWTITRITSIDDLRERPQYDVPTARNQTDHELPDQSGPGHSQVPEIVIPKVEQESKALPNHKSDQKRVSEPKYATPVITGIASTLDKNMLSSPRYVNAPRADLPTM